jgi:hypothetical protein
MHEIIVAANRVENFEDDLGVITGHSASKPVFSPALDLTPVSYACER